MLDQEEAARMQERWLVAQLPVLARGYQEEEQEQEAERRVEAKPEEACDQGCDAPDQRANALLPSYLPRVSRSLLRPDWQATVRRDGFRPLRCWRLLPKARPLAPPGQSQHRQ